MKILILSWRGPGHPHEGGAEIVTHEHAKAWVKAGHEVTLFTSAYAGCREHEQVDGIDVIRRGGQAFGVKLEAFKWYLFGKHEPFDLVFDHFHGLPFFTPLYIRVRKIAFIHEVAKEVWKLNSWSFPLNLIPSILGTLLEPIMFLLFYKSMQFICVSESTREDLVTWGIPKRNIEIIHNGVIIHQTDKVINREKEVTITFLGALSKDKGAEDVIDIFSLLVRNSFTGNMWIIGKGGDSYVDALKSRALARGIEKHIKFWGFVSENKKFELLRRSHLIINPSIREGWGLVVIEAAACGTPTVGYIVPGLKDSIKDKETGLLCRPTPEDCAQVVQELIFNKTLYNHLSKNCVKWSKEFSWSKSIEKSLKLIKDAN